MANRHSLRWRKPGRRDEERKRFAALMRRVEAFRLRSGMSKTALAAELETTLGALRKWLSGQTIGRKETVAKIKDFLKRE
jgi:ribosome-binding protein aMBF1 (putative translation factor)